MVLALLLTTALTYGLLLVAAGFGLQLAIGQRRFNRRSATGFQQYPNYWIGLLTMAFESILTILSVLMIIAGLFLIVVELFYQR